MNTIVVYSDTGQLAECEKSEFYFFISIFHVFDSKHRVRNHVIPHGHLYTDGTRPNKLHFCQSENKPR